MRDYIGNKNLTKTVRANSKLVSENQNQSIIYQQSVLGSISQGVNENSN